MFIIDKGVLCVKDYVPRELNLEQMVLLYPNAIQVP